MQAGTANLDLRRIKYLKKIHFSTVFFEFFQQRIKIFYLTG